MSTHDIRAELEARIAALEAERVQFAAAWRTFKAGSYVLGGLSPSMQEAIARLDALPTVPGPDPYTDPSVRAFVRAAMSYVAIKDEADGAIDTGRRYELIYYLLPERWDALLGAYVTLPADVCEAVGKEQGNG